MIIKTMSFIAKTSVYGSSAFTSIDLENQVFCQGETGSTAYSPTNADTYVTDMLKREVTRKAREFESKGFKKINSSEFYELQRGQR